MEKLEMKNKQKQLDENCTTMWYGEQDLNKHEIPINVKKAIRMIAKTSQYSEEDFQKMYIMRQSNFTYKQIGIEFCVSADAIRQKISRINIFASRFKC